MQYKIAICDDEPLHIEKIRNILLDEETETYTSPTVLLNTIFSGKRYDVLFLDIMMPEIDGISLARELRELDGDMLIVFIKAKLNLCKPGMKSRHSGIC